MSHLEFLHDVNKFLSSTICSGEPGYLEQTELDTAHFMGNFPESCELHALYSEDVSQARPALLRMMVGSHSKPLDHPHSK